MKFSKASPNSIIVILIPVFFSCKASSRRTNDIEHASNPSHEASTRTGETENKTQLESSITLHLFDDDERIIVLESRDLAGKKASELPDNLEMLQYGSYLDSEIISRIKSIQSSPEAEPSIETNETSQKKTFALNRIFRGPKTDVETGRSLERLSRWKGHQKKIVRKIEGIQEFRRSLTKGKDYKREYFEKAINNKRADPNYRQFDRMSPIESSVYIGDPLPKTVKGENIYLGMLPDRNILMRIRRDIQESSGKTPTDENFVSLVSIIEDFELSFAKKNGLGIEENLIPKTGIKPLGDGRFKVELRVDGDKVRNLGINRWNQYSTPDRTMLNSRVLTGAIDDLAKAMEAGSYVYTHCKSGKGRSATVVVGGRAAVLIDHAKKQRIQLTRKQVDLIISEQIAQVKASRSLTGVSRFQQTNLSRVLYERAIVGS